MTMNSGIYRIDLGDGWFYIGSAINLRRRESEHRSQLKCGRHSNQIMQRCWNKYEIFVFSILEICEIPKLLLQEQHYIDIYFSDYKNANMCSTAGSTLGRTLSDETRAKLSAINKGKVVPLETRKKISTTSKGRVFSDETRAKISFAKKGQFHSAESKAKMSASTKGRKGHIPSDETRAKLVAAWVIRKNKSK
jgi:group I intron endonuclease